MRSLAFRFMKHKNSLIALAITVGASSLAGAAQKSSTSKTAKPVVKAPTKATAPQTAKTARKSRSKDDSVEAALRFEQGDETGNEVKALKTEMLVMKSEKRALAQLLRLQTKYAGKPMEPEILFRLAELYMRRARSHRFFEVHKSSDQVMSFVPSLVRQASEAAEIRKAIAIYEKIQKRFPQHRNMDVVVFNTAYARQQLGEDKVAEALFSRITTEHPGSMLVPDSYLAIGEINYHRRAFEKALESFKQVRRFPEARVYPYGLYKAAWCYYNMQDGMSAMKQLEEVVKFGRTVAEQNMDSKLDLRKEALNDMALFFGDVMPSSKAVDYLLTQAHGLDPAPILMRLSNLYNRHSRFADVEVVLRGMLTRLPDTTSAPSIHEELVWNYERMRLRQKAVVQMMEMNDFCRAMPEPKRSKEKSAVNSKAECLTKVADASKRLATKWHALWKHKQPTEELAAASEQAYKIYLENGAASVDPELAKIRYQYAEILFQRKNYREASAQYALVQDAKPDAKLSHDASYASVVSLEKAVDAKWNDVDEKLFMKLSDVYLTKHARGEWALELQFKRAFIAYEKERYDEAAAGFKKIGWSATVTDKNRERIVKSQDLYLDILNVKKDYTTLKNASRSLVQRGISDGTRLATMEKIYREAYFAEIQQMEEKGDLKAAVAAYKKFALENKTAELSGKAWWNASQLQFKMGDAQGGAETCHQMHKLFPQSTNGKDCLMKAAQTFEASGRLENAARVLLNLAMADEAQAEKWREISADFFALSGDRSRAKTMYMKLAEGKKPGRQLELFEKTMALEKLEENTKGVRAVQQKILALGLEPSTSQFSMEQAEEMFAKRQHTEAFALARKVLGKGVNKELQARARYLQAQVLEDEFRKQSVKSRVERIAMVLGMKTEKLEKAQRAYQEAIKYGDPRVSVMALRRLADCYLHYVQSVREMPLPASLNEQEMQAFKGELDALVIPMEEKGLDSLTQALTAARKFELHDGSVAEIQAEINKVNMKGAGGTVAEPKAPGIVLPSFPSSSLAGF